LQHCMLIITACLPAPLRRFSPPSSRTFICSKVSRSRPKPSPLRSRIAQRRRRKVAAVDAIGSFAGGWHGSPAPPTHPPQSAAPSRWGTAGTHLAQRGPLELRGRQRRGRAKGTGSSLAGPGGGRESRTHWHGWAHRRQPRHPPLIDLGCAYITVGPPPPQAMPSIYREARLK
jgi:hypothetical protein